MNHDRGIPTIKDPWGFLTPGHPSEYLSGTPIKESRTYKINLPVNVVTGLKGVTGIRVPHSQYYRPSRLTLGTLYERDGPVFDFCYGWESGPLSDRSTWPVVFSTVHRYTGDPLHRPTKVGPT